MQPTKAIFNDSILLGGLACVALWVWGPNVHYGHACMASLFAFAALSLMTNNVWLIAFGVFTSIWYAHLYSATFSVAIPDVVVLQVIESTLFISSGLIIYSIVKYGKTSIQLWKDAICTISILLAVIGIAQFQVVKVATSTLGCSNFLAAFLAIATPFFFRKGWFFALPVILLAIWDAHTSMAILALAVGVGAYFWKLKGMLAGMIPGLFYLTCIDNHTIQNVATEERVAFWSDAAVKVSSHWYTLLFGVGPGIYWRTDNMLHSEYVYLLFNFGLVGVLIAAGYIIKQFSFLKYPHYRIPDRSLFAAMIIILINAIGNHLLHTAPTAVLAIIIFALNERIASNK
jgi:hypothetical protein